MSSIIFCDFSKISSLTLSQSSRILIDSKNSSVHSLASFQASVNFEAIFLKASLVPTKAFLISFLNLLDSSLVHSSASPSTSPSQRTIVSIRSGISLEKTSGISSVKISWTLSMYQPGTSSSKKSFTSLLNQPVVASYPVTMPPTEVWYTFVTPSTASSEMSTILPQTFFPHFVKSFHKPAFDVENKMHKHIKKDLILIVL